MATIPRAAVVYLTEELNGISADAQAKVSRVLAEINWTPDNIAECRQLVLEALSVVMPTYTDLAAQASADFYDAERELSVGEPLGAQAVSGYDLAKTEGAVKGFVSRIVDGNDVPGFNDLVLQRVDYEMKRSSGYCMTDNGARDPLKPRYARVPVGAETCPFCIMLASRGFVYHSRQSAGALDHWHASCDCRIVCGWDEDTVEGYDTDALFDRYVQDLESGRLNLGTVAKNTSHVGRWSSEKFESFADFGRYIDGAESMEDLQFRCAVCDEEFKKTGLSKKYYHELAAYVRRKKTELKLSDPAIAPGAIYEKPRSALEEHEMAGVDHLVANGIRPVVRWEDPNADANIDLEIDGEMYEMKNVTNDSSASNQVKRARIKWRKLKIDTPMRSVFTTEGSSLTFDDLCSSLESRRRDGELFIVVSESGDIVRLV